MLVEDRFPCMGSDAHVIVTGERVAGLVELARARLDRLERTWSRFLPDSELSLANATPGEWHDVSDDTVALVDRALRAAAATDGLFDPTRLQDVVAAGYVSSIAPVDVGPVRVLDGTVLDDPVCADPDPPRAGRWPDDLGRNAVDLDRPGRRLRVAPGCGFDPGGIAKGFAADLIVDELRRAGAGGACVNVGGDLRVSGGDESWTVDVEDPLDPAGPPVTRLTLAEGAVATSSRCRRRWTRPDGTAAHHLVDPRTGAPARTDVLTATVVASEGWVAEALATAAFLAGPDAAADLVVGAGATGVLVTSAGVVVLPGLDAFTGASTRASVC